MYKEYNKVQLNVKKSPSQYRVLAHAQVYSIKLNEYKSPRP